VTGALCLGAAARIPGTVVHGVANQDEPGVVVIEHPAGSLETRMSTRDDGSGVPIFERAGIVRTARPLLEGVVHVADDALTP
jgi:2-methylaconitate cis-trans-isomerase PrpF